MKQVDKPSADLTGSADSSVAVTGSGGGTIAYQDNPIISALPNHLKQFIVDQNYAAYTPVNHAVWRYVMRQNFAFLKDYAHKAYVDGLLRTGIGIERIPSIESMNEILGRIGWAAVPVDGFIPPAAFMEFQAHRVLVVAADMRQINHIEYTPAPDIIHEAAGHAPIIADPEYAEYLRRIGYIGSRAMSSKKDFELYQAIRHLSILKELDNPNPTEVEAAERDVEDKQQNLGEPSEMARLSRLHWWTVEYGLSGDIDNPKIYGAGLLSSIGESASCLSPEVKKLPYNLDTQDFAFDITTKQPHLFVTSDFKHLIDVVEQFADTMAYRVGGCEGLTKAIECRNACTAQYSSGLQVSGVLVDCRCRPNEAQPYFIRTSGPSALALSDTQVDGHGADYHADGFSSPIGRLKGESTPLEQMSDGDLDRLGIIADGPATLEFESGIVVTGRCERVLRHEGQIVLLTLADCTVTDANEVLFQPEWGMFDMAVGASITSVFSGAADKTAYEEVSLVPRERTIKIDHDENTLALFDLYQSVRDCREGRRDKATLTSVWRELSSKYTDDWLLATEIIEILQAENLHPELSSAIRTYLGDLSERRPEISKLIDDGLALID